MCGESALASSFSRSLLAFYRSENGFLHVRKFENASTSKKRVRGKRHFRKQDYIGGEGVLTAQTAASEEIRHKYNCVCPTFPSPLLCSRCQDRLSRVLKVTADT